ncbi:MAG: hypothetical protein IPK88_17905 [Saprospiraceae bacterium]|nr:hypothetical protein [Candidatus Defluviibacterium haderslevense]
MPIDFYTTPCANPDGNCTTNTLPCLANIPNPQFGITDEAGGNSTPARVDIANPEIWDLTITNNSGVDVIFKAVDWCVLIFRTGIYDLDDENRTIVQFSSDNVGTEWIKRCEGFLQFDNKICFIEIKRIRTQPSKWIKDAREKFEETILSFKEHHPHLASQITKPILVNPKHAGLAPTEMIQKRILKDIIGVEFTRQKSITI